MIITGGENVYPFEVEKVLYEHPAVLEAAVVGVKDKTWGEAVTAAVALKQGTQASEDELVTFVRERIAGYKTPKRVIFMDSIPKTAIGKILRREVREMLEEQQL
jgi:fatty-acyl-CoA synthase